MALRRLHRGQPAGPSTFSAPLVAGEPIIYTEIQSQDMRRLHEIQTGESARLSSVGGERSFRRRLMELGFLPGTLVRLVRSVPVGDLVELEIRGSHISLRQSEAGALGFEHTR